MAFKKSSGLSSLNIHSPKLKCVREKGQIEICPIERSNWNVSGKKVKEKCVRGKGQIEMCPGKASEQKCVRKSCMRVDDLIRALKYVDVKISYHSFLTNIWLCQTTFYLDSGQNLNIPSSMSRLTKIING